MTNVHQLFSSIEDQQRQIEETKTEFDGGDGGGYDAGMEVRVAKLESDITAIKIDVAVIKANGATKSDIADVRTAVAEAKSAIILWVAGIVFLAQVVPSLIRLLEKYL